MSTFLKSFVNTSFKAIQRLTNPVWLLCVLAIAGALPTVSAQTTIDIGTAVKQSGAKRFGINLANQDFYDSGMMLRNLVFRNPGFEGETWTTILQCHVVTSTTCQDANIYSAWPANFMQNATYTFMTGPATGQTGTVTSQDAASYSANVGPKLHYAAPSVQPNVDDYVQVRTTIPGNAAAGFLLLNQSGVAVSADTNPADQAPGTTGKQCLQIVGPNAGQSVQFAALFDTTAGRSFIQLNGSFTLTFKAKSIGGNNQFNLQVFRGTTPQTNYLNQNVALTNTWKTYSYTFNAAETGKSVGAVGAYFNFNGNSVLLDDLDMSPDKNAYNTPFRDEVVQTLLTLKPGVLRYMDSAQGMGTTFDNIIKDQFGRQRAGWSSGITSIDTVPVGLFDFLQLCKAVGAEPYWTMPTATTPAEMAHIMEYMAGSSATPYGAIRAAQGQSAPWTTVFPTIHMELGNEVWNGGSFSGETMTDPDRHGQWTNTVFTAAKATPYYAGNASKFDFVIGTLQVNEYTTQHEMDACAACDAVAVATYMGTTLSDVSSLEAIYGPLMAFAQFEDGPVASASNTVSNHMFLQSQVAKGIGVSDAWGTKNPRPVVVYETNLGLTSGTAPQGVVNSANAGVGAGVSQANHMLMMLRDLGVKTQNMFALSEYINGFWGSGAATVPLWGTVIDMGGPTNLKRPEFLGEQLANSAILPTMLTTVQTGDNPTWNQALNANQIQLNNVLYLQSYAFTDGTNNNLVVINLHRTASLPVKFTGVNAPVGNINVSQLTSANITDINETSPNVNITYTNIPNFDPTKAYSLPPFSMTVFSPGAVLPSSTTNLTVTPTSINVGQSVSISAVVTSSGSNTPTGTVTFLDGATSLGTATLDGTGTATHSSSSLAAGSHSIVASYGGDSTDARSASSAVAVNVAGPTTVATTTTLSASGTTVAKGQSVTFTGTVTPQSGTGKPSGTLTFSDGGATIGTGTLNASGIATFSTTTLGVGPHTINATYGGDTNNSGSASSTITVTVTQGVSASSNTLTYAPSSPTTTVNVLLYAKITATSGNGIPTGTVTFMNGAKVTGTGTLDGGGVATTQAGTMWAGTYNFTAVYSGDGTNSASTSSAVTVVVAPAITATTLAASATTANPGQSITFTASVTKGMFPIGTVTFKDGTTVIGTATLTTPGTWALTTSTLVAGLHSITASYSGDSQNGASASSATGVTVSQTVVATTTTLASSATTATTGQNVTFTAAVSPQTGTGVVTGTITFSDGATNIGTGNLNASGVATFSTVALATGAHSIKASYGGDAKDTASASTTITVTISPAVAVTTSTLTPSTTTAKTGQNISFTATVTPQSSTGIPTGTVTFSDGAATMGAGALNASGTSTFNTTTLGTGSHNIKATYGGDSKDAASASPTIAITVTQTIAPTTTTLVASATSVMTGQPVNFTATVAPQSGTGIPSGSVTFSDGGTTIGTGTLNGSGIAVFSTGALIAGSHNIAATYGGDTKDTASASPAVTVNVTQSAVATTTSITASASAAVTGQSVSFTAVVARISGSVIPTGTVKFEEGQIILGTATVNASGVATFSTTTLTAGTHNVGALYSGDAADAGSGSLSVQVTISQGLAATTTVLTTSAVTAQTGQNVTLSVTVAAQSGSNVPTGTVTLMDGTTTLGTAALNSTAVAVLTTSRLAVGSHIITASYSGDTKDNVSSSTAVTVVISQAVVATSTSLLVTPSTLSTGQSISLTATVAPQSGTGVATGSVRFLDGTTALGSALLNASGSAVFSTTSLVAGIHAITAIYSGDTMNAISTSPAASVIVSQTIAATTTSLTASAANAVTGQSVTFAATVALTTGSGLPTGTVAFSDGTAVLGTGMVNANGVASFSTTTLAAGVHAITAAYGGDAKDAASASSAVTVNISQTLAATSTSISASTATATTGQNITFNANVSPKSGTGVPTGTVTFLDGGVAIGTASLNASGAATITTSTLTAGAHSVTASYFGDAKDTASVSSAVTVNISQTLATTSTTISASAATATTGQSVTFNANVSPKSGTGVPTGTVTFLDGAVAIGTASLNASGAATITTSTLTAGLHSVTASYFGDAKDTASASSAVAVNITQPVGATTTTLSVSPAIVLFGQGVTMTAAVAPLSGNRIPTGTVNFYNGQTLLHTSNLNAGTATFSTSLLALGTYSITAAYSSDQLDAASVSPAVSLVVTLPPDYTLSLNVTNVSVTTAQAAAATVSVIPVNGFSKTVQLACSGLPPGATCSFAPAAVTPSGGGTVSSALTISMGASAAVHVPVVAPLNGVTYGMLLPWGLVSLLGIGAGGKRSRFSSWTARLVSVGVLLGASLAMTGCGFTITTPSATTTAQTTPVNYLVTITGTGADATTHSEVITLLVTP